MEGVRKDLWVVHLDMDAFFASVEQRDNPRLRGKPVIVGGSPNGRGVVSTCSYEARKFGVRSAMPAREALRLCPHAVFVRHNMSKYVEVSRAVRQLMQRYTEIIEPMSVDEAYMDVTGQDAVAVARSLRADIRRELNLTGSAGVSYCKFLAKMASDMEKPDGLTVIDWERAQALMPTLPVRRLHGIGPAGEQALKAVGINTCGDILAFDPDVLRRHFGRRADDLILLAQGTDTRPVETSQEVKSIGEENTFARDQSDRNALDTLLEQYAANLAGDLGRHSLACKTVTVKIKWNVFVDGGPKGGDFLSITRSQTLPVPTTDAAVIGAAAKEILSRIDFEGRKVRLLGLSLHNFLHPGELFQPRFPL